jgi:hypothetical protein
MADPISSYLKDDLMTQLVDRLRQAGYMSPQGPQFVGLGFACAQCDWYTGPRKGFPAETRNLIGMCNNPNILSPVERQGCCDLYRFKGVDSIPSGVT